MIDVDAFLERCAILEFGAGLSRYQAECAAARMQDCSRWEAMKAVKDAERMGNSGQARDHGKAAQRHGANRLPPVQSGSEEQAGPVPERDV
jgi:hypothetical protein